MSFDSEGFMDYYRADKLNQPVVKDRQTGKYRLAQNYLREYVENKSLFEVYGTADRVPTSLIPDGPQIGDSTAMSFTPLAQYLQERDEGKNDFGRAYVEAAYSGLMRMKKGGAMLGAAAYDKFLLEDDMKPMVQRVQDFYDNNIFNKINEVEGLGPVLVEGLIQYMVPYAGARKLFTTLTRNPVVSSIFDKTIKNATANRIAKNTVIGTGAIGGMTAVAVSPGEENAVKFIAEITGLPEGEAGTFYNKMYEYFTDVEDVPHGVDSDAVVREKTRGFFGDLPIDASISGLIEGYRIAGKGIPAVKFLGTLMLMTEVLKETKDLNVEQLERLQAASKNNKEEE
jgi:hypothetical protein